MHPHMHIIPLFSGGLVFWSPSFCEESKGLINWENTQMFCSIQKECREDERIKERVKRCGQNCVL